MTDLQAKYQKLATEYSKLRAQIPVLKKAVLDEQANEEQLKTELKEKDLSIRKYEQEVDSLSFRNNQLSTRVTVLQQELDEAYARHKKNKKPNAVNMVADNHSCSNASILDEELRNKIEENARLHKQVYESEQQHHEEVSRLTDQLTVLRAESTQHESVLSTIKSTSDDRISRLLEEKALLEGKFQRMDYELRASRQRAAEFEQQLRAVEQDLTSQITDLTTIVQQKIAFNDSSMPELSAWNVPRHDHRHHQQARDLLGQANTLVTDVMHAFDSFLRHSEHRVKVFADAVGEPINDTGKKYCQHVRDAPTYVQQVTQSFQTFCDDVTDDSIILLEALPGLQAVASRWSDFVTFMQKLLPYQLLSIEAECALSSCPASLAAKNMDVHSSLRCLAAALSSVNVYVSLLAAQSNVMCTYPSENRSKMYEQLARCLCDFYEAAKALSRHFNGKMTLEHQLPTASQKLRVSDECLLSAFVSLVTATSKLSVFVSGNLSFFTTTPCGKSVSTSSPAVGVLRQRAVGYLTSISRPAPESVPYLTALQNRRTVYSFTENKDGLTQQIVSLQERLSQLEQEREHWMLETQLMKMKYDKESQKLKQVQKNSVPQSTVRSSTEGDVTVSRSALEGAEDASAGATASVTAEECEVREQLITQHYTRRVAELTSMLQMADSKAVNFFAECRALQKHLSAASRERDLLEKELHTTSQSSAQLRDELQTMSRSYEGQLSMMSEHMAAMNEKIVQQTDVIDVLKYQLDQQQQSKFGRKGKLGK